MRRRLIRLCLLAIILAVAGFLLLGIPGIPILYAATLLTKPLGAAELGGDQVWPATLGISLVSPFALIPAGWLAPRIATSPRAQLLSTIAAALVIAVLATSIGLLLNS